MLCRSLPRIYEPGKLPLCILSRPSHFKPLALQQVTLCAHTLPRTLRLDTLHPHFASTLCLFCIHTLPLPSTLCMHALPPHFASTLALSRFPVCAPRTHPRRICVPVCCCCLSFVLVCSPSLSLSLSPSSLFFVSQPTNRFKGTTRFCTHAYTHAYTRQPTRRHTLFSPLHHTHTHTHTHGDTVHFHQRSTTHAHRCIRPRTGN